MNEVVDINQLIELAQVQAINIGNLSNQMRLANKAISDIADRQDAIDLEQKHLSKRMDAFEENERIDRTQDRNIKAAIAKRSANLLNIEYEGGRVADKSIATDAKYRGGFIARCYSDARNNAHLGSPRSETKKKDYDSVMEYIEAWRPEVEDGVEGYKRYLDIRSAERKGVD